MPRSPKGKPQLAEVVDLAKVRADARIVACRKRVTRALESNKRAVTRLFTAGVLFTKEGSRIGRDLLLANQLLLRVDDRLDRLAEMTGKEPISAHRIISLYSELDSLIDRTSVLTNRTGEWLEQLRSE